MGMVVAAHHVQLDERVALKFLLSEALATPDALVRFMREARAAVKIKSEHVARVHDVGQLDSGMPYMVMEYLEGSDLAAWLRERGPMQRRPDPARAALPRHLHSHDGAQLGGGHALRAKPVRASAGPDPSTAVGLRILAGAEAGGPAALVLSPRCPIRPPLRPTRVWKASRAPAT